MELLTLEQAAARLGVSIDTVRRWVRSGRLTAIRIGPRTTRIDPRDLEDLVNDSPNSRAG
jgi:excisionase family DNA binding protein